MLLFVSPWDELDYFKNVRKKKLILVIALQLLFSIPFFFFFYLIADFAEELIVHAIIPHMLD